MSGSTGLIGTRFVAARRSLGDEVVRLVRRDGTPDAVQWDPSGELDPAAVSGFDAVVHLAGEPVANRRWTAAKKRRIRDSRVEGTRRLGRALAAAHRPPTVFVCASGINIYGDPGDTVVDEDSPVGQGFLAEVCKGWEAAATALGAVSRVVNLRLGVVLSPEGGALGATLPLFRLGLAGPIAGGDAFVSWVTLDDAVRAIGHILGSDHLHGPVNVVAPEPVRGREFTASIAGAVGKPAVIPVPAWVARLLLGEMAAETVLASIRVAPLRLLEDGFHFGAANVRQAVAEFDLKRK